MRPSLVPNVGRIAWRSSTRPAASFFSMPAATRSLLNWRSSRSVTQTTFVPLLSLACRMRHSRRAWSKPGVTGSVSSLPFLFPTQQGRVATVPPYRYAYLWLGGGYMFIFADWAGVYYYWKKLGGKNYVPPEG